MGSVIIIPADSDKLVETLKRDKQPTLDELQKWVGGYIEAVPYWEAHLGKPAVVYCNEEGKLDGLPLNQRATGLWWSVLGQPVDDVLVGDVVIVVDLPDKEED